MAKSRQKLWVIFFTSILCRWDIIFMVGTVEKEPTNKVKTIYWVYQLDINPEIGAHLVVWTTNEGSALQEVAHVVVPFADQLERFLDDLLLLTLILKEYISLKKIGSFKQCSGSGSIFDGSGSSWRKKTDPDSLIISHLTVNETNIFSILYLVGT